MKPLVLALAFLAADDGGSLGVGMDVVPVAYTFAANRLDFFPELRLKSCDRTSCRWATGHGTDLTAYVTEWDLAINRLEIDAASLTAEEDKLWFQRACLTVVALTLNGADRAEVRSIADRITSEPDTAPSGRREQLVAGIRFYGASTAIGRPDGARQVCGAVVNIRN